MEGPCEGPTEQEAMDAEAGREQDRMQGSTPTGVSPTPRHRGACLASLRLVLIRSILIRETAKFPSPFL